MNSDIHPDLVFAILKAGSSINIPERITQDIDEIFDSVSFPRYTQSELKAIQLKIEEGKQSLFDILTEYSFNFPFLNTLLEKIVTVDKNDEIWDFLSLAVLHSFIAWNNLLTFQKSMPPVTSLLRAMIFILKSYQINFLCNSHMLTQNEIYTSKSALSKIKPIKIIAKNNPRNNQPIEINSSHNYLVKLIVYSFVFAIKIFISHASEAEMYSTADDIIEFSKIVHSPELILFYLNGFWNFSSFFTNQNFFNFISNISKVSAQFEDENLPDLIISENDSIDIILGITSNNTNNNSINRYFNETQTNSLLMTLRNFIIQLEPSSLNLMAVIAKPLSPEIGKLIIPHIGKTIEPLILTNKPFELPIPDQTYVTFTKFENYNIPLDFPVIDSFPNGFNPKNACVYFPDPISIEHLFNENVLNIVSNIALIIGNNMNFCEALIDSFNESLEMHKETQFYGSIYAILIFIVYQIYRKFPQISFPSKICIKLYNEKIFHPGITVFHETNNYSIINTLRSLALELILNDSKNENEETNFYMKEKSNNLAKSNANEISANENEIVNVEENEENNTCAINNILVDAFCPHPLLLAEVFQRLSENVSLFYHKIQKYPQLIDTLIQIAINYQRFELESQMESLESVRKARTSIFILFSRLLSIQKVCLLFFSRQIFVINFLAFAFEQKLTQLVFGIYKTFLIAASPEQIEATTQIAFSILTVLVSKLAYRKSKEILLTMLESINEAMINHPQINHLFANDCSIVFMAIPMISQSIQRKNSINIIEGVFNNLDQNESNRLQTQRRRRLTRSNTTNTISFDGAKTNDISLLNKKLIQEMIQFFALTASFYTITEEQVDILITTLLSFKDPNFVLDSYNRFIQLLAGDCLPSLKPCFIIRQPQILKLFIRVLIDSPKLHEILTFIYELCNFSLINIKVCIASELDLFLLDLLARDKNEEKFSHETVELILNLFSILSIRHSSNRAVYDYIGLIAMINPTTVYQHEQLLIDSLDSIINLSMNEPASTFALVHNNVMRFGIDPKFIGKKGFTFVCWLNIEEKVKDYEPDIFKLSFADGSYFRLSIQHTVLIATQEDNEIDSSGKIGEILDMNNWHFLTLTFLLDEENTQVIFDIDIQNSNKLVMSPLGKPLDMNKKAIFSLGGTSIENSVNAQFPSRISNVGLFPILTNDQKIELFELGKRIVSNTLPVKEIKYIYSFKEQSSETTGFLNILTQQCGLSPLLPLFKMKSMVLRDGTKFEMSLDFILQLISRILSSSFSCQKKFYKDHGFSIIRYLIINYWLDKFTFKTYISLFSLLQNLKYEELQIHLFVEILANFSFLMKLEEKQIQLRILKNWQQSLFDSCRTIAVKTGLIKQILPAITQFFLNNDHKQHRQYLFKILRNSIESSGFDMSFIEHIMGHALICDKIEVIGEINQFLNTIIIDSKDLFNFKLESNFFIFYIYYYLHHTLEFLQIQGFQILASVYSSKIITPAFASKLVYLLIETYPETALHKQMFDFVSVNLINSHFFLPLFFYLAHKMKIDSISKFLHPSSEYAIGSHWAIWPLIYCIDHPSEQDKILTFLIHSCQNDFCQLFSQLNFVYFHNHSVLTVMSEKFITILQMMAVENPQCSQIAADFYELSQFILLFKLKIPKFIKSFSRNDMVDEITELKPGSLPNHINTLDKTKMISSISTNFNKLQQFHQIHFLNSNNTHSKIEDIVKLPDSTPLLEFYVKIKKNHLNYSWEGRTLAIKNMQMYKQKSLNEYLFFILSLCGFLEASINLSSSPEQNGFKYDGIMEFITSLNLKETEVSENKIAVQIINYHRVCSEKDPIEYSGKVTNPLVVEEKYAQFIEKNRPLRFEASIREAFKRMGLFIKNLKDRVIELENENVKLYTNDTLKLANDFKENLLYYDKKGKRLWVKLWNIMNFNCAPWFMNECEKNMYGRSTVLTPYVPTKITRSGPNFNAPAFTGKPLYQLNCDLITVVKKTPVVLTVYDNGLSIQWRKRVFRISLNWIEDIIKRPNGFEIYTVFGVTFCLGCEVNSIAKFLEILSSNLKMSFSDENCLQEYTKLWTECKISNFEYILLLNKLDGRSFHDLHNYPIVPWLTKSFKTVKTNHSSEDMVNLHLANSSLDNSILDSSITENDGSCSLNQINNSFNSPIGFNHNILDEMKINFKLDIDLRKPFKNDRVERNDILLYLSSIEPFKSFKDVGNFNDIEDLVAKTHSELIPEFFAFEKINMSLDNNLEFVYNHRKLLESPDVSSVLHHWLGRIFLKGKVHPHKNFAIFSKEFTEKCSIETRSGNFLSAKFFSFNKIEFFAKGANTIHSLTLIIHDMNENSSQNHTSLVKTNSELDTSNLGQTETRRSKNVNRKVPKSASLHQRLNFLSSRTARSDLSLSSHIKDSGEFSPSDDSNISVNNNEKKIKIERQKKDVFNFSQIDEVILSVTGGFWVVKSSDGHIFIVDSLNRLSTSSRHINISNYISNLNNPISKNYSRNFVMQLPVKNVKHFSTDGRWIAISYISSSVIDIFYDMILISSIETFENRINLLVCNDRKKMIICVVRDKLFLCDAVCGCISKVVEVKNIKKVIISDEWGFIICYVETTHKKKFLIYSENGDFLKEIYVNEKVIFMKPFKTIKGIDFMLYTLESGNAFILDIFEGNIHGPILMTFSDKIVDASYYEISRTLMTFTENGTVTFVPLELPF